MDPITISERVVGTDFVPKQLRHNGPAVLACILKGNELGLGPMQSLTSISLIEGKPTLSAEGQRALVLAAGHELIVEESTASRCTVIGRRRDSRQTTSVTWTLDDAKRANLAGKENWRTYPRQMLQARATAELARLIFPDVIGGLAATEELEGSRDLDIQPEPSSPPAATTRRRRRPSAATPEPRGEVEPGQDAAIEPEPEPPTPQPTPPPDPEPVDLPKIQTPEPIPEPDPATPNQAQMSRLMALCREHGLTTSQQRHDYAAQTLGRDIESSTLLTATDVSLLIEHLENELPDLVVDAINEQPELGE